MQGGYWNPGTVADKRDKDVEGEADVPNGELPRTSRSAADHRKDRRGKLPSRLGERGQLYSLKLPKIHLLSFPVKRVVKFVTLPVSFIQGMRFSVREHSTITF